MKALAWAEIAAEKADGDYGVIYQDTRCPESMTFRDHGTRRCIHPASERHRHFTAIPVVMDDGNTYLDVYTWERTT